MACARRDSGGVINSDFRLSLFRTLNSFFCNCRRIGGGWPSVLSAVCFIYIYTLFYIYIYTLFYSESATP